MNKSEVEKSPGFQSDFIHKKFCRFTAFILLHEGVKKTLIRKNLVGETSKDSEFIKGSVFY